MIDDRACLSMRGAACNKLKRVYQRTPFSVRLTDRNPYACSLRKPVPGSPGGDPHLAHSNAREIAAFLVTRWGPRKGRPFPSLRRRASSPTNHLMNRRLTIKTPTNDRRSIFHPTRERKIPSPNILTWMRNSTSTGTRGRKETRGKLSTFQPGEHDLVGITIRP